MEHEHVKNILSLVGINSFNMAKELWKQPKADWKYFYFEDYADVWTIV